MSLVPVPAAPSAPGPWGAAGRAARRGAGTAERGQRIWGFLCPFAVQRGGVGGLCLLVAAGNAKGAMRHFGMAVRTGESRSRACPFPLRSSSECLGQKRDFYLKYTPWQRRGKAGEGFFQHYRAADKHLTLHF